MVKDRMSHKTSQRRGIVILLTAGFLLIAIMLAAVAIDVGFMALTKSQLQAAADSAALAGGTDLSKGLGFDPTLGVTATQALARQSCVTMASDNRAGDLTSVYCNPTRDVRFGNAVYNDASKTWTLSWGTQPYNLIGVTLLRNQTGSTSGDGPLPLFFSGLLGASASLTVTASAALLPANTVLIPAGQTSSLLPVAVDVSSNAADTWNAVVNGNGTTDSYSVNTTTNAVTNGADGIKEFNLYPIANTFGLANLGAGNAASAIGTQIQNGVTATDLANIGFPNGFTATPTAPASIGESNGLKASLKSSFDAILGEPRTAVMYQTTSNGTFQAIGFVGLRIVNVQLTGNNKAIWAQPATVVDATYQPGIDQNVTSSTTAFAPVILVQ